MAKKDVTKKDETSKTTEASVKPTATKTEEKKKENMIEVPKSVLDDILKAQDDIKREMEDKDKTIKALKFAADKSRLAHYDSKNNEAGELIRTANIGLWEMESDKMFVLLGWKMQQNKVYVEPGTGKVVEDQTIVLFLHDPSLDEVDEKNIQKIEVQYISFMRNLKRERCNIIKESRGAKGETRVMQMKDGKEYEIDVKFINP